MGALQYIHLPANSPPSGIEIQKPFKAVVIVEQEVQDDWRDIVSKWLVDKGCLYMMAWGRDCSKWDDSVDWACIELTDKLVMTTWHPDESLEEVFEFSKCFTSAEAEFKQTLLIDISEENRKDEILSRYETVSRQ